MKIAITGVTGMIGMNLVEHLKSQDVMIYGGIRAGSDAARLKSVDPQINIVDVDITDYASVAAIVEGIRPDRIIHLAASTYNPPPDVPVDHFRVNAIGTANLFDAVREHSRETRILVAGSGSVYGSRTGSSEVDALRPNTVFGASKVAISALVDAYRLEHDLDITELRLFTPFGPWEAPGRLIPHLIISAIDSLSPSIAGGTQTRDFVYVGDVVDAFMLALRAKNRLPAAINIGSGTGRSIKEVAETVLHVLGSDLEVNIMPPGEARPHEIWEMEGLNDLARKQLDWRPQIAFEDGIRKTADWITENRKSINEDKIGVNCG